MNIINSCFEFTAFYATVIQSSADFALFPERLSEKGADKR